MYSQHSGQTLVTRKEREKCGNVENSATFRDLEEAEWQSVAHLHLARLPDPQQSGLGSVSRASQEPHAHRADCCSCGRSSRALAADREAATDTHGLSPATACSRFPFL